jgi:hypothetical protein
MIADPDPIASRRRHARRLAKLPPDAACLLCGETTPDALRAVSRTVLERHHVLGGANDPELVVALCRNCHAGLTEAQQRLGVELRRERIGTLPELLVSAMRSLAGLLFALAERLRVWADQLAALVDVLDQQHPDWRQLPEAAA